ncbi:enoyl-CoA hydratase/isomerase family protein, partial [Acinetobacter baumannii]
LNRPDSLNALDDQMIDALNQYFGDLARNTRTRIVVLKGAGRAFCAGLDLKEAMSRRPPNAPPASVADALDHQRSIADIVM